MAELATAERKKVRLNGLLTRLARLRGTGPNPFDYWIWADETRAVLGVLFGAESAEARDFAEIVLDRGRMVETRGNLDNMTLGLHGEWGIWARLDRAEMLLATLVERGERAGRLNEVMAEMGEPRPAGG